VAKRCKVKANFLNWSLFLFHWPEWHYCSASAHFYIT